MSVSRRRLLTAATSACLPGKAFCRQFAEAGPLPLIGTHDEIARAAVGATLENLPGEIILVLYPATAPQQIIYEARRGGSYTQTASIYTPAPRKRGLLQRTVLLHYHADDTRNAHRAARLIARLLHLHRAHFGQDTTFYHAAPTAEVWFNAPPPAHRTEWGGETWTHHVYLYAPPVPDKESPDKGGLDKGGKERSLIEWVRTLCHEWGHLTLPAARGFDSPENDAAGFLGERLYLKWLSEDTATVADDFVTPDGLTLYQNRQVLPLIARLHDGGPASSDLKRRDTDGMDYYIALALASDTAFGSRLLARALFPILSEKPDELVRTLREAVQNSAAFTVRLPAWVPLERGTYQVSGPQTGTLHIADRPLVCHIYSGQPLDCDTTGLEMDSCGNRRY